MKESAADWNVVLRFLSSCFGSKAEQPYNQQHIPSSLQPGHLMMDG
jgi:hypothetical protein